MCICLYVCVCVRARACVCVCARACVCVCLSSCVFITGTSGGVQVHVIIRKSNTDFLRLTATLSPLG